MKLATDAAAVFSTIRPQSTIVLHSGCAEPSEMACRLVDGVRGVDGVRLIAFMPMGSSPYASSERTSATRVQTFFPGRGLRKAVASGQAELLRYRLSEIPGLFERRDIKADVLLLKVSPPDQFGKMSLGISVDYMPAVLEQKPLVVVEIDPRMPRTLGQTTLLPEQVDHVFESWEPPQVVDPAEPTDIDRRIASNVAGLIGDGAVVQAGIGALPDLVLGQLGHLRHLGIHSGIITDAIVPLVRSGVITNATKAIHRGKCITTIAAGTQAFYDFLSENEVIEFHPCSMTHAAGVLAAIDGLVAVNGVLEVDLAGRANAERMQGRVIAGPGGLPDFATGATAARGGLSIVALRATSPSGDRSNVRVSLSPDAPVTLDCDQIDCIVTEFGVAHVRSLTALQRAKAIVSVAHPDCRDDLRKSMRDDY